ncbi:MAG: extracellular solute-binding protein, partial [Treponema sp.]|nr:extracellular solute-binding protein [Treponema sp.]
MKKVMQFVLSGCLALALAGCSKQQGGSSSPSASSGSSGSSGSSAKQEKVITFWHLDTTDAQQAAWRTIADRFDAKHPGVKIEITVLANDSFKQKLSTVMQSGWAPDVFRSWGGGGMYDQEDAGMLRDISG